MPTRDPDEAAVALFRHHAVKNDASSASQGRPIYDDMEICEIRFPGSRNVYVFPATAFSHWQNDPATNDQIPVTYAERFSRQYRQFKEQHQQTKAGTPLQHVPFLTEGKRAELRALNIYTVEQLAAIEGAELKNLGTYGREFKNKAREFLDEAQTNAPVTAMASELEQLRARNAVLEEDAKLTPKPKPRDHTEGEFDGMDIDQLREFITTNSGHAPHGSIGRKTLIRMAQGMQQKVT